MPRSNLRTATLGEGISTSTGTSRSVTQGMRMLPNVSHGKGFGLELDLQDCHEDSKPEFL